MKSNPANVIIIFTGDNQLLNDGIFQVIVDGHQISTKNVADSLGGRDQHADFSVSGIPGSWKDILALGGQNVQF